MKAKLPKALLLLALPLLYFAFSGNASEEKKENVTFKSSNINYVPVSPPPPSFKDEFVNCIFNKGYESTNAGLYFTNRLDEIKDYNFTSVQAYHWGNAGDIYGEFATPLDSTQINNVNNMMSLVAGAPYNFKGIYNRAKLADLCLHGQRVVYEVSNGGSTTENYGFCWETVANTVYGTDHGRTIWKCSTGVNSAGYIGRDIYENMQHSDLFLWGWGDAGTWYAKPMMKIDSTVVDNNPTMDIAKIEIRKFNGRLLKEVTLKARNFAKKNTSTNEYDYNGDYVEKFDFSEEVPTVNLSFSGAQNSSGLNDEWEDVYSSTGQVTKPSQVDFRVYWYGQADIWFDKLTVDNEMANQLFNPDPLINHDSKIQQEVQNFANNSNNYFFFVDEITAANIPCIEYTFNKAKTYNGGNDIKMSVAITNAFNMAGVRREHPLSFELLLDKIQPQVFTVDAHEISKWDYYPESIKLHSTINPLLPVADWEATYAEYTDYLQYACFGDKSEETGRSTDAEFRFNPSMPEPRGSLVYQVNKARDFRDTYSPNTKFIMQPQLHSWIKKRGGTYHKHSMREPLNEEIEAQAVISLSHGADGLCWFIYDSWEFEATDASTTSNGVRPPANQLMDYQAGDNDYHYGLAELHSNDPRLENDFGQPKYTYVKAMNLKLLKWKPTLDVIDWYAGYSVHAEGSNKEFISGIQSKAPYMAGLNSCVDGPTDAYYDCAEESYWELGFFAPKDESSHLKYFTAVNRRCEPEYVQSGNPKGDVRVLKIDFDAADLPGFVNWKITDVAEPTKFKIFDKNTAGAIDLGSTSGGLGWFKPGEGKLFKLEPVMRGGGTLVADEVTGESFKSYGKVYNNGFNITLEPGTVIEFADTAGIVMSAGEFICGDDQSMGAFPQVTLKGLSGTWKGLSLSGCPSEIYKTKFEDIADSNYAVTAYNCSHFKVNLSGFDMEENTGAINGSFALDIDAPVVVQVNGNTFAHTDGSTLPALVLTSTGSSTVPALITNNSFNVSSTEEPSNAVFLNGIIGGAMRNNTIEDYSSGVILLASSVDLLNNTITAGSGLSGSVGILGASETTIGMQFQSPYYIGGVNRISNFGTGSKNLEVDYSIFNIDHGYNTFDIKDNPSTEYHLYGSYNNPMALIINATNNCFNRGGTDGDDYADALSIPADYMPFACVTEYEPDDFLLVDYGKGVIDTIDISGEGMGGGSSSQLPIKNDELRINPSHSGKWIPAFAGMTEEIASRMLAMTELSELDELYATACLETRKRNYNFSETACIEILDEYPNSTQALDAVQKLYLASLMQDSAGGKMSPLKTYLEALILANPENSALIERAFYYIQKTKAALGQYQSALDGFQQIINQNPATYEALVASWDYAAVTLLMGNGGGFASDEGAKQPIQWSASLAPDAEANNPSGTSKWIPASAGMTAEQLQQWINNDDPRDKYDQDKFTKEDRKLLRTSVVNAYTDKRTKEAEKQKELQTKADNGDEHAKKELQTKRVLTEQVKVYKPDNMQEHINNINSSIKAVFGRNTEQDNKDNSSILPETFALHQNYPNPFNPTTKISFDLPKDGTVTLVIYDILGREAAKLINSEVRAAGTHTIDFNGSKLASGIYFYRIEVTGTDKFVMTRRMALIK